MAGMARNPCHRCKVDLTVPVQSKGAGMQNTASGSSSGTALVDACRGLAFPVSWCLDTAEKIASWAQVL